MNKDQFKLSKASVIDVIVTERVQVQDQGTRN